MFGPFRLHPERHLLLKGGRPVPIGSRALDILIALIDHAGDLVTKDQLIAHAWPKSIVEESSLRPKLRRCERRFMTAAATRTTSLPYQAEAIGSLRPFHT